MAHIIMYARRSAPLCVTTYIWDTFGRGRVEGGGGEGGGRGAGEGHQPDVVSGDGDSDVSPSLSPSLLSPSQEARIPKSNIVTDQAKFE